MPHEKATVGISLADFYDPDLVRELYSNIRKLTIPPEEPGIWDNLYDAFAPIGYVSPEGRLSPGLGDSDQRPLPLSEIYKGLDVCGVVASAIAPIGSFIEGILLAREKNYLYGIQNKVKEKSEERWHDFLNRHTWNYEWRNRVLDLQIKELNVEKLRKEVYT